MVCIVFCVSVDVHCVVRLCWPVLCDALVVVCMVLRLVLCSLCCAREYEISASLENPASLFLQSGYIDAKNPDRQQKEKQKQLGHFYEALARMVQE